MHKRLCASGQNLFTKKLSLRGPIETVYSNLLKTNTQGSNFTAILIAVNFRNTDSEISSCCFVPPQLLTPSVTRISLTDPTLNSGWITPRIIRSRPSCLLFKSLFVQGSPTSLDWILELLDWTRGELILLKHKEFKIPSKNRCRWSHYINPRTQIMGCVLRNISAATSIPILNPGVFINFLKEIPWFLVKKLSYDSVLNRVKIRAFHVINSINEG